MARFRRFRRAAGFARGAWGYRKRFGRKGGRFGGQIGLPIIAGVGVGFVAPVVHPLQDTIITALAVLPVRLPYGIKSVSQGYVLGRLVKGFVGGSASTGGDFV